MNTGIRYCFQRPSKTALISAPILTYYDLSPNAAPFILDTDASSHAIGGAPSQVLSDGKDHVISYGSRTLDKAERNYSTTRRVMLALVSFTKKNSPYLKTKRSRSTRTIKPLYG